MRKAQHARTLLGPVRRVQEVAEGVRRGCASPGIGSVRVASSTGCLACLLRS